MSLSEPEFNSRLSALHSGVEQLRRDGLESGTLVTENIRRKMKEFPHHSHQDLNIRVKDSVVVPPDNIREFVQDFLDRCGFLNDGEYPAVTFDSYATKESDRCNLWTLRRSSDMMILGIIVEMIVDGCPIHTTLSNYNTILDPIILSGGAVQHYGEDINTTISRFYAMNYKVMYRTGCMQWDFVQDFNKCLALFTQIPPTPDTKLTVEIPYDLYKAGRCIKPICINDYLMLNPVYNEIFTDQNISLILPAKETGQSGDHIAGSIYIRGVRVTSSACGSAVGNSTGFAKL